jgi:prepilin-type N-terminal cleavage/methylation domain-containing protein
MNSNGRTQGMTLVELLVAVGLGSIVLAVTATLFTFGLRCFTALGNHASLSGQSRLAMDRMSQEIRQATQIIGAEPNLPVKWLAVTNAIDGTRSQFTWDSTTGVLTWDKTGQPTVTNLIGCTEWDFSFFQRCPSPSSDNWVFYPTTDLTLCKLLTLSWRCSRPMFGQGPDNQDSFTAQVVLRNKP